MPAGARHALLAAAAALIVGGCGSSSAHLAGTTGPAVFATACSACHSLVGDESQHTQGGDLLGFHMSRADVFSFTRVMPRASELSAAQLKAVTDYVFAAQQRAAPSARRRSTGAAR